MNQSGDLQGSWCSVQCSLFLRSQKSNRWFNYPDISGFLRRPSDQPLVTPAGRYLNCLIDLALIIQPWLRRTPWKSSLHVLRPCFPLKTRAAFSRGSSLKCVSSFHGPSVLFASVELLFERDMAQQVQVCPGEGTDSAGAWRCPLGITQETSAGLPFKAAQPVGAKFSPESPHVNLSLLWSAGFGRAQGWVCAGSGDLDH